MSLPDLAQFVIQDPKVRALIGAGQRDEAARFARIRAAAAQTDLAIAELAAGRRDEAYRLLAHVIADAPECRAAFHNLVAAKLGAGALRGSGLNTLHEHLLRYHREVPWMKDYSFLLWLPDFLNVELVRGRCNLRCRMCVGRHRAEYPGELSFVSADDFRRMLGAAPTVSAVTLSSGDSEPLLHPDLADIAAAAKSAGVLLDIYTNGQLLRDDVIALLLDAGCVNMLNVSVDAATADTYRAIRGASLDRLIERIEALQSAKRTRGVDRPWVSLSFVAMADNIRELPEFVDLARRLGANRVFVEDLMGWEGFDSPNRPASDDPDWRDYAADALRRSEGAGLRLSLPRRFLPADQPREKNDLAAQACSWLTGLYVRTDGTLQPCCMVAGAADMGNLLDGPLTANVKFLHAKSLLAQGKVFPQCVGKCMCSYLQHCAAAGWQPALVTADDLGPCRIHPAAPAQAGARPAATLSDSDQPARVVGRLAAPAAEPVLVAKE